MTGPGILLIVLAGLAAIVIGVFIVIYLIVPLFQALGWILRQIVRFIIGEVTDIARFVGSVITAIVYIPLILINIVIGRWSASKHFGRSLQDEGSAMAKALYRICIGHPIRLVGLGSMTEGIEKRIPAAVAAAPTSDKPTRRTGQFEGYKITGSLAGGGSGAKLYIAEPDDVKRAALERLGFGDVDQVVIKSFSMSEGSSLPQIVRESRSLDAAKRLGLILDHDLQPDRFFYVMRFVPGDSLTLVTKRLHAESEAGGLSGKQLRSALRYACDLVGTLSLYHQGGLWHKDVKPDNIIVDTSIPGGRAQLVDFGLLSSLRSAMTLTTHGTEYFRDPEMVRLALKGVKVHEVDGTRFDIYGAGAVLFSVMEDSFPAHGVLSQFGSRCPDAVKWIVRRAMTDYDKRYPSAALMLADLRTVAESPDPFAVRPADLPSMKADAVELDEPKAEHEDGPVNIPFPPPAPAVAAAEPTPPPAPHADPHADLHAGSVPPARPGRAPRIRVTNWWTGKSVVEDSGDPASPAATDPFKSLGLAAQAAVAKVTPAKASPAAPAAPAARAPKPGPRRPAGEQLASARARVRAAQDRAAERMNARGHRHRKSTGGGVGVGIAVVVFFLAFAGLAGSLFLVRSGPEMHTAVEINHTEPRIAIAPPDAPIPPELIGNGADAVTVSTGSGQARVTVTHESGRRETTHRRPAPAPAAAPVEIPVVPSGTRALILSDLRAPVAEAAVDRTVAFTSMLDASGFEIVGSVPGVTEAPESTVLEELASIRLAAGRTPLESGDARTAIGRWIDERRDRADAVIWLSPQQDSDLPRIFVFTPATSTGAEDVAVLRALQHAASNLPAAAPR